MEFIPKGITLKISVFVPMIRLTPTKLFGRHKETRVPDKSIKPD